MPRLALLNPALRQRGSALFELMFEMDTLINFLCQGVVDGSEIFRAL